jgi:hypothetical protein
MRKYPVPEEFREAVADIISGARVPNKKAGAKLKLPAAELMQIAGAISTILGLCDVIRTGTVEGIDSVAARKEPVAQEPKELVRELHREARKCIADSAKDLDVSVETIENLLREMRARIIRWPVV